MALLITWALSALAIYLTPFIVPGFVVNNFASALIASVVLGLINAVIRPIFLLLTLPINILTLGLFTLVINASMLYLATLVVPGMSVDGFWSAILAALIISIISTIFSSIFKANK